MPSLNDPELVAREYEDESRLVARRRAWREFLEGENSDDLTFRAVAERAPRSILEVGCGWGELAERMTRELDAVVVAFDRSARMTQLARDRGVRVLRADAQAIPIRDASMESVVANAVLYHVPDLDRGLAEIARVLVDGGRFVATVFDAGRFRELFALVGQSPPDIPVTVDNAEELLRPRFERIEARLGTHALVFPNAHEVRTYLASTITMRHLADRVEDFEGELRTERTFGVFVAEGPRRRLA
jgi:ubiquinone/menaquinone biosynthesis C-methylase UbiE